MSRSLLLVSSRISRIRARNFPLTHSIMNLLGAKIRKTPEPSSACRGRIQVLNCCEGSSAFKQSIQFCQSATATFTCPCSILLLCLWNNSNHWVGSYPLRGKQKCGFLKCFYSFIYQLVTLLPLIITESKIYKKVGLSESLLTNNLWISCD